MRPKVLYLMHMPPPIHGAALVGLQIKNSDIINRDFEGYYINTSLAKNLSDLGGLGIKKIILYFKILISTCKVLQNNKFTFCYITPSATGGAFVKDFILTMLVKLFRVKIIFHFHNKGFSKMQEKAVYNFLYKHLFRDTKTILLSESLYYDIRKYVKEEDVFYSYVGISPEIIKDHIKKQTNEIQFVFLSNLIKDKGIFEFLKACKILKQRGYHFSFIIAGGETNEMNSSQLNDLIVSYEIQDLVKYLGRISEDEKHTLLSESDVFVFPTFYHNECFPAVILEAMKNSLAVISTFEGAIPTEVIDGETGLLCKQKDVNDLADKMETFIKNPHLAPLFGLKGKEIFYQKFTSEIFEARMCDIFNKCYN